MVAKMMKLKDFSFSVNQKLQSLKEAFPWIFAFGVIWIFLLSASRVMNFRIENNHVPWDSDFAMFYQAGRLFVHGDFSEIYRYITDDPATKVGLPKVWQDYMLHNSGWGTYYYGQTPWHAMLMSIPGLMSFKSAFILSGVVNILSLLLAAVIVWRFTKYGFVWGSLILLMPIFAPIIGGYQWEAQPLVFQWDIWSTPDLGTRGNALTAAMWLGQPTPVILLFLVLYLVATKNKIYNLAALFAILAVMKPSVIFAIPLGLLLTDEWGKLLKWGLIWSILFSIFFSIIPELGFPDSFMRVAFSYTSALLPNIFQSHNWVWIYGSIVSTVAFYWHGR